MPTALDVAPLLAPAPPAEVRAYRDRQRADGGGAATRVIAIVVAAMGAGVIALTMLFVIIGMLATAVVQGAPGQAILALALGAVTAFVVWLIIRGAVRGGAVWERWTRIDAFARANGLRFSPREPSPGYRGLIFGIGSDRAVVEHCCATTGRFVDMGGYVFTTGSGRNRRVHRWSFLAIRLDRRLPNMVLDARQNNGVLGSNLPVALARDQVLHLEGDFDRYFTLYCPKDYERDALYVFTPDLMALLIDEAAPFDVEIVDDWFFAYSSRPLDMLQPATYGRLFRIIDTVGAKAVGQTERYRDDRMPDALAANLVAPAGRTLRRRWSVGGVIAIALLAGFAIVQIVSWSLR
jgi:hypothetical protein